ncbi:hypothetical protein JCM1840_006434 [Sporobolomyces johnsonii]
MDEDSPWGAPSDFTASLPRPPSPKLSYTPPASAGFNAPLTSTWGDDGGWGSTVEEYGAFGSTPASGVEVTTEEIELDRDNDAPLSSVVLDSGGGWGASTSPEMPKLDLPSSSDRPPSPPGFAPSPPLAPVGLPRLSSPTPSALHDTSLSSTAAPPSASPSATIVEDDRGWAPASPELPPIGNLRISAPASPSKADRTSGWGDPEESSWEPPAIPEPLPSLGDVFGGARADRSSEKGVVPDGEEAWGSARGWEESRAREQSASEAVQGGADEESWAGEPSQGYVKGKSIPAALVDGLKVDSRELANSNWTVSQDSWGKGGFQEGGADVLTQPPDLPASSPTSSQPPITNDTPLPSLFRLTPTLFPKFREGLGKTAARSAETLQGSSSRAFRNAKFGLKDTRPASDQQKDPWDAASGLGTAAPGHEGDEFDLDHASRAKPAAKSSWWGASGGGDAQKGKSKEEDNDANTVGIPETQQGESGRIASPEPGQQGALGRFFSRLKRQPTPTDATGTSANQAQGRSSGEQQQQRDVNWNEDDFDALGSGEIGRIAQTKKEDAEMDNALGGFFGDRLAARTRVATAPPEDDFGGLLGAFAQAPAKPVVKPQTAKAYDPFDPLSDDSGSTSAAPALAPSRASIPPVLPPPLPPNRSSLSHSPQLSLPSDVASFPALAAPQARPASSLATSSSSADDSFDAFFDSVAASTGNKPSSVPIPSPPLPSNRRPASIILPKLATSQRSSVASPIPRMATISPPTRTSTVSPASSGAATPILPLAPPPPPSQPLAAGRGGFNIAPPPQATQRVSTPLQPLSAVPLAPAPAAAPVKPTAPSRAASGPLSMDDLSFFES